MASTLRRPGCWLGLFAAPLALLAAAPLPPPTNPTPLLPTVAAYAASHDIPVEAVDVATDAGPGRAGDAITILMTLRKGGSSKQWLSTLQISAPTDHERAASPPGQMSLNGPSGRIHRFATGVKVALDIRTVGPFVAGTNSPPNEKHSRALISPDLLGLGLDEACRTMIRAGEAARPKDDTAHPATATPPPLLSEADERAAVGFVPALFSFFDAIQNTPGLREILWEIMEKPSVWSIVKHGGKVDLGINIGKGDVAVLPSYPGWPVPGLSLYRLSLGFALNDQPALVCSLFVTSPRPPLLTTAGIIGIVAKTPGRTDRHLDVRILAGRRAPAQASRLSP